MEKELKVIGLYLSKRYPFIIGASYGYDEKYPKDIFVRPHVSYSKLVEAFPHVKFNYYSSAYKLGIYFFSSLISFREEFKKHEKFFDKLRNDIDEDIRLFGRSGIYPFENQDKMLEQFLIYE